ncbi:MAG TPA: acyl-CoA dehydrogenase family protein [Mycobacteriales bacterium]|nr:acyl-CoA dehydrogenase family protein [Mycobacteriales bacterium]
MTTFVFTDEQLELRAAVRRFLDARSPSTEVRRLMETDDGYDAAVWSQMAEQLGLQGIAIPEDHGGSGCGPVEQLVVLEEMGRALLCAPYFSSVILAANALLASGDVAACKDYLPGIADGSLIATVAGAEANGDWLAPPTVAASASAAGYLLTGLKSYVLDGHTAELLLVTAMAPDGPSLFAVEPGAGGVQRRRLETIDMTRKLATVTFTEAPARLVGAAGAAAQIVDAVLGRAVVALAAEQVGGAQACLDMAVEYAKLRVQFGRQIGSFQAIKHKCADMLLDVESARSAAYYAAWTAQDRPAELAMVASLAKAYCSEAYVRTAAENIQVHGGIGFTWEHDAHLYYRRARSSEAMFSTPNDHWDAVAGHLLDARAAAT